MRKHIWTGVKPPGNAWTRESHGFTLESAEDWDVLPDQNCKARSTTQVDLTSHSMICVVDCPMRAKFFGDPKHDSVPSVIYACTAGVTDPWRWNFCGILRGCIGLGHPELINHHLWWCLSSADNAHRLFSSDVHANWVLHHGPLNKVAWHAM